jgi:hypothetical protein
MRFAKLLPSCPASGALTASAQSAQADFVSPAPDFNPGNLTDRSVVFQSGNNKAKSINARISFTTHTPFPSPSLKSRLKQLDKQTKVCYAAACTLTTTERPSAYARATRLMLQKCNFTQCTRGIRGHKGEVIAECKVQSEKCKMWACHHYR